MQAVILETCSLPNVMEPVKIYVPTHMYDEVLIVGTSGGVGSYAVQIAKSCDSYVSAACSTKNADFVRSLGEDEIIGNSLEDFIRSGKLYDLIHAVGGRRSIFDYRRALKPDGIYVLVGGSAAQYFSATILGPLLSMGGSQRMGSFLANPNQNDYDLLIELCEAGKLSPSIDKRFPLSEVPAAMRYYGDGQVKVKIVINVDHYNYP